jgi:hypothetical protein
MVSRTPPPKKKRLRKFSEKILTFQGKKISISATGEGRATVLDDERGDTGSCREVVVDDLLLVNCHNGESIIPSKPCRIENDLLSGHMLPLLPTRDGDCVEHFQGKKRKVELQFQFKFKRVPDGQLFLGCELRSPLNVGYMHRALLKAVIGTFQRKNDLQFNLGINRRNHCERSGSQFIRNESRNRNPNMAMPLESSINSLVITKEGETPPTLGEVLDGHTICKGEVNFNTHDTYTFAIWSAHFDLIHWKCINLAPIQPFALNMVIGDQPFTLNLYSVSPMDGKVDKYLDVEFSHGQFTTASTHKHKTMAHNASQDSLLNISSESDDDDDIREDTKNEVRETYLEQGCEWWSACDALDFSEHSFQLS